MLVRLDGCKVEIEKAVFRVKHLQISADGAAGFAKGLPVESTDLRRKRLPVGFIEIKSEKVAGSLVDKSNEAVGVEKDDPFPEGFKDFFEESFFVDEPLDDLLDFSVFYAVKACDKFFEESRFHVRERFGG